MAYLEFRHLGSPVRAVALACGSLCAPLTAGPVQTTSPGTDSLSLQRIGLVIHATDKRSNPLPWDSLKGIEVTERGEKLQIVDSPNSAGPRQIALLLDSNFHQGRVLAIEKRAALELLSEFEKGRARVLVTSYGAEIHSSGELTDDWAALKGFTGSLRAETDKRNRAILLFDAIGGALKKLGGAGTKAVIVFAEGNDFGSSTDWKSLARLAQHDHIACYFVLFADHSFYGAKAVRHYGWDLIEVAPKTGGKLWEVGDSSRKSMETTQQLVAALDSQRLIEVLVPDIRANRFHAVKITVNGRPIEAQTGYFDGENP
jgi:hypothetical protein